MKKILSLFTSAVVCFCSFSCQNNNNISDNSVPDSDQSAVQEPEILEDYPFMELSASDFSDITVSLQQNKGDPPFDLKHIDLSGLDLGQETPACFLPDVVDTYHHINAEPDTESYNYQMKFRQDMNAPTSADITAFTVKDDRVFFGASFDKFCNPSHHSAIFEYDTSSGNVRKIVEFVLNENGGNISDLAFADDCLFAISNYDNNCFLHKINVSSGDDEIISDDDFAMFGDYDDEKLIISTYLDDNNEFHLYEYVFSSGELREFKPFDTDYSSLTPDLLSYTTIDRESHSTIIHTPFYSINTGLRNVELISADKEICNVVEKVADSNYFKSIIHQYNIRSRQCFVLDTLSTNDEFYASGDLIIKNSYGTSIIVPSIGQEFFMMPQDMDNEFQEYDILSKSKYINGSLITFRTIMDYHMQLSPDETSSESYSMSVKPLDIVYCNIQ